ncbi:MAG: S-layer homology domain-containing protein [Halanaerobium sp.]
MFKYKSIILLSLMLILMFSVGLSAQEFEDVPRDHWAYDSVQTLAEEGYLSLYSGEDFNGEEPLTRYEMAEIIANILENSVGGTAAEDLSEEDVDVIRELSLEFRDELVTVAQRQKDFEEKLAELEDTNQIQNEDISNINADLAEMREDVQNVSNLEESIDQIDSQIAGLEEELATVQEEGASNQKLEDLEDSQSTNLSRIEELENRIDELESEKAETVEEEEDTEGLSSLNTGYILGGLALLALIL